MARLLLLLAAITVAIFLYHILTPPVGQWLENQRSGNRSLMTMGRPSYPLEQQPELDQLILAGGSVAGDRVTGWSE